MTVVDSYGSTEIPLVPVSAGQAAGDALLTTLGAYLTACLNYYATDAWQAIGPGRGNCVRGYQTNDPGDSTFNANDLPALYVWRDPRLERFEQIADDIKVCIATVRIVWVPPPAVQVNRSEWSPFLKQIAKVIDYALWNGRDPAWVLAGDTDAYASTRGSLWTRHAGLFYPNVTLSRCEVVPIEITMADGSAGRSYQGIHCILETTEEMDAGNPRRIDKYPSLLTATIKNEEGDTMVVIDGADPLLDGGFPDSTYVNEFDALGP